MCGIVGAVAERNVVEILLEGLKKDWSIAAMIQLEWRYCKATARLRVFAVQAKYKSLLM